MNGPILRGQIDTYLEEAKAAIKNLIGLKIFPEYGSPLQSGQYLKLRIALAELLNADVARHSPGAAFVRYTRTFEYANFDTIEYGIEELVPYVQADETGRYGLDQQSKAAELAMRRMLLAHEIRVASQVFNSGNFTVLQPSVNYTTANGGQASNGVNVVNDILTARRQLEIQGIDPFNLTLVISSPLWDYVKQSLILQNYLRGNRPTDSDKLMQPQDFAALFDLKDVLVGRASYNTAGKNVVPAVLSYIWNNSYWALVEIVGGDFSAGGVGRTIFWEKYGNLFTSEEYPEYQRDSAVVRVKGNMIETVVNLTAGVLTQTYANF